MRIRWRRVAAVVAAGVAVTAGGVLWFGAAGVVAAVAANFAVGLAAFPWCAKFD